MGSTTQASAQTADHPPSGSESRCRELFARISSGIAVFEAIDDGQDFILTEFNRAAEKIEQISRADVVGRRVTAAFPGVAQFGLLDVLRRVWQTGVAEQHPVAWYQDDRIAGWRDNSVYRLPSGEVVAVYDDATQRRTSEETLRASEGRLAGIVNSITDHMSMMDQDFSILWANDVARRVFGRHLIGRKCYEVYHGRHDPCEHCVVRQVFEDGQTHEHESTVTTKDGRTVDFWCTAAVAAWHPDGRPKAVVEISRDITERRRTAEQTRERERFLDSVFEGVQDGLCVLDRDLNIIRANARLEGDYARKGPLAGHKCFAVFNDRTVPCPHCPVLKTLDTGEPHDQTVSSSSAQTPEGWLHLSAFPLQDGDGRVTGSIVHVKDVTKERKAEQDLRASEERFRTVADFAFDWEYWAAPNGEMLYVSPSCKRITGYPTHQFTSDPALLSRIVAPEDRDAFAHHVHEEQHGQAPGSLVFRINTRDGQQRWIEHSCQAVRDSAGRCQGRRASNRDITDRVLADRERRSLEEQLRQAQKLEAVGTLAAGIAHDFNNALTAIMAHTEMARLTAGDSADLVPEIEGIEEAARIASGISRSLLTFCYETPTKMAPLHFGRFVANAARVLERMLPAIVEVSVSVEPEDELWVLADDIQLHQVLMNLVVNARDAMPNGGRLDFTVRRQTLDTVKSWTKVTAGQHGAVVLTVEDTGIGMASEVLARVCDPFFTTKTRERGTGLGMSVVHGLIEAHGGQMQIASRPGKGTRVSIALPGQPAPKTIAEPTIPERPPAGPALTVLLADDSRQVRAVISDMLEVDGHRVVPANDGDQAWQLFEQNHDEFGLAIIDVDMPKMLGTTTLERIHAVRPDLPAILISGFQQDDSVSPTRPHVRLLQKPFRVPDLRKLVRDLSRQSPTPSA